MSAAADALMGIFGFKRVEDVMNKFTPGPWEVVADERYDPFFCADKIVGYDVKSSAGEVVGSEGISGDSDINLANARLIAAAPELLEALELADAVMSGANMDMRIVELKVKAAIAKARGKA